MRPFLLYGAVFLFLAVAAGAFGAHALRDRITADMLAIPSTSSARPCKVWYCTPV